MSIRATRAVLPRAVLLRAVVPRAVLLRAVLVGVILVALSPSTASAHNVLVSTMPASGATLARTPDVVILTFDEPAVALGTQIVVTGPRGPVQVGAPRLVGSTVRQTLRPGAPSGSYTVQWRVTSDDGHPITGTFRFTAAAAGGRSGPGASTPGAPPSSPSGPGTNWVFGALVGVLVLLGLAAAAVLLARRARRRPRP